MQNAGGLVADPSDGGAVRAALEQVLTGRPAALGNPQAAARFAADNVAEEMMMLLREVTG